MSVTSGYRRQRVVTYESFDVSGRISLLDEEVRRKIVRYTNGSEPHGIESWGKYERDLMLQKLKAEGLSIRQIERATGIFAWSDSKMLTK